ncbi:unnamed protein product [Coffea canephora]|uniref:S-adenosylmethionine-dependent methyltransferase At5g38100 n=1 Tax=Coffea canephora TaxID=49390 RepID=A0A068V6V4_COFCA|nr:unnamed protein product [Coffea canephora]
MANDSTASLDQSSSSMNCGNGNFSYSKNSTLQRVGSMKANTIIEEVIADRLIIEKFSTSSNTVRIADLGCSVGPNTYFAMQHIIGAIEKKCESKGLSPSQFPEFQVFFNDQTTNDFNTLFTCLPPEKKYFVAGVPGSFHGQLFPSSSMNIVYSSFSFHWLSQVPKEVQMKDSPSWNKGRIFYASASDEVAQAYAAQFARDFDSILIARGKEIISGGIMFTFMLALQDGCHPSKHILSFFLDAAGSILMDMAHEGLITAAQVDSFNMPLYLGTPKEITGLIERNGWFSIERLKFLDHKPGVDEPIEPSKHTAHLRAVIQDFIGAHFGAEIIDELFDRLHTNIAAHRDLHLSLSKAGVLLFVALRRK